jgi:hypothetical protein
VPAFVPSAATLLQAAADDLEHEVLPALAGAPRFRARIVLNVLRLVTRELEQAPQADVAERQRLAALLGDGGDALPRLRAELAGRIERGEIPLDDPALVAHLTTGLREALAIDSPGWTHERRQR